MEQDIDYKGYKIKIRQDESCESPDDWGNDDIFLVYAHRQFDVRRKGFEPRKIYESLQEIDCCPEYNNYWIFPVDAYIHSGVHISLANTKNYPDRRWDVSTTGYILASKEDWTEVEDAYKAAESLVEEWNQYLSGEVYGFIIEKPNEYYTINKDDLLKLYNNRINRTVSVGLSEIIEIATLDYDWEQIDSCWGYYGEPETSGLLDEAKAVIDYKTR